MQLIFSCIFSCLPVCEDKRDDCTLVANEQYCEDNYDLMEDMCPKSCGICTSQFVIVFLSICLITACHFVCVCDSVFLPVCPFVSLPVSVCLSIRLSVCIVLLFFFIYMQLSHSYCLSVCLSAFSFPSINLSVCLLNFIFILSQMLQQLLRQQTKVSCDSWTAYKLQYQ